jgi:hypothetical protein
MRKEEKKWRPRNLGMLLHARHGLAVFAPDRVRGRGKCDRIGRVAARISRAVALGLSLLPGFAAPGRCERGRASPEQIVF